MHNLSVKWGKTISCRLTDYNNYDLFLRYPHAWKMILKMAILHAKFTKITLQLRTTVLYWFIGFFRKARNILQWELEPWGNFLFAENSYWHGRRNTNMQSKYRRKWMACFQKTVDLNFVDCGWKIPTRQLRMWISYLRFVINSGQDLLKISFRLKGAASRSRGIFANLRG